MTTLYPETKKLHPHTNQFREELSSKETGKEEKDFFFVKPMKGTTGEGGWGMRPNHVCLREFFYLLFFFPRPPSPSVGPTRKILVPNANNHAGKNFVVASHR